MKLSNPSSFRDPSGFVFTEGNKIFRQINYVYKDDYEYLMSSGLYENLTRSELLVRHEELPVPKNSNAYKIILLQKIPFVSYPYEWCFGELKDATLLTLKILKRALAHGMVLKDASGFNVQFLSGRPIFIDTLSFERYEDGRPWIAYRQFCEQLLAPLALAAYQDTRLISLVRGLFGVVPLDLTSKLLPVRAKLNFGIMMHIVLHARSQREIKEISKSFEKSRSFTRVSFLGLIDSLESTVRSLRVPPSKTVWTDYSSLNNSPSYLPESLKDKQKLVKKYITLAKPKYVWDIGANTGLFSRIAASSGAVVVSMDSDSSVVEQNYLETKINKEKNVLPLIIDITNPTPPLGWAGVERDSLLSRPHPDCVMALALIHHLAIANNIPLGRIAQFFSTLAPLLIIEFIPKEDKQVKVLLANRKDIFPVYSQHDFEIEFNRYFTIIEKHKIGGSVRTLYFMKGKPGK